MANKKMDEKFYEGLIKHLTEVQHIGFELDQFDSDDVTTVGEIVEGVFQHIANTLGENKSEAEPFELELPGLATFKVAFREGSEGNWGDGFTSGSDFRKRIKGDADAEQIMDDEDED